MTRREQAAIAGLFRFALQLAVADGKSRSSKSVERPVCTEIDSCLANIDCKSGNITSIRSDIAASTVPILKSTIHLLQKIQQENEIKAWFNIRDLNQRHALESIEWQLGKQRDEPRIPFWTSVLGKAEHEGLLRRLVECEESEGHLNRDLDAETRLMLAEKVAESIDELHDNLTCGIESPRGQRKVPIFKDAGKGQSQMAVLCNTFRVSHVEITKVGPRKWDQQEKNFSHPAIVLLDETR